MTTLVTGATGLVGNNVVRLLVARGEKVRVLVRHSSNLASLEGLPVELACGDIRDAASVGAAFRGVERAIHAAASVHIGWHGLAEQRADNVEGTRNVAEAAWRCGARLVYVSSIDALAVHPHGEVVDEDTPGTSNVLCPYVVTKREAERVVLDLVAKGLDAVIVNPGFMLGPWDWKPSSGRMLLKAASGWAVLAPPGTNSFCDVRDVAEGIVAALVRGRGGQRYILGGKTLSYMDALLIFARIMGQRPPLRVARRMTVKAVGSMGDLLAWLTGGESEVNSAATEMSMLAKNYSSARAGAELGYQTRDIEQSATDAWKWLRDYGYVKRRG